MPKLSARIRSDCSYGSGSGAAADPLILPIEVPTVPEVDATDNCDADVDVVLLDLGLPGRNGLDVLRNWRAGGVTTPVIVLTARDAWHERVDGFKAGADDYLGKPFHVEELLARIEAMIGRREGGLSGQ